MLFYGIDNFRAKMIKLSTDLEPGLCRFAVSSECQITCRHVDVTPDVHSLIRGSSGDAFPGRHLYVLEQLTRTNHIAIPPIETAIFALLETLINSSRIYLKYFGSLEYSQILA